jgi:hypothetical protein
VTLENIPVCLVTLSHYFFWLDREVTTAPAGPELPLLAFGPEAAATRLALVLATRPDPVGTLSAIK